MFRKDRNKHCDGVLFYGNVDMPCKGIGTFCFSEGIETIGLEIDFHGKKRIVLGSYKPPNQSKMTFLTGIQNSKNHFLYFKNLINGDFNCVLKV